MRWSRKSRTVQSLTHAGAINQLNKRGRSKRRERPSPLNDDRDEEIVQNASERGKLVAAVRINQVNQAEEEQIITGMGDGLEFHIMTGRA